MSERLRGNTAAAGSNAILLPSNETAALSAAPVRTTRGPRRRRSSLVALEWFILEATRGPIRLDSSCAGGVTNADAGAVDCLGFL